MQSEELELVKCCAKMLRLTGVTAACTQDSTTHCMGDSAVPHRPASSFPAGHKQLAGAHCASSSPCCSWKNYLRGSITELQQRCRNALQPESEYWIDVGEGLPARGMEKFPSIQAWLCKTVSSPLAVFFLCCSYHYFLDITQNL